MHERPGIDDQHSAEDKIPQVNPYTAIASIQAEIMAMGSVDFEPDALEQIKEDLRSRKIDGPEAIRRARTIQSSRQDYH